MTSEKSGQTKGKRPVGPWTRIDSERERWVRPIGGDDSGDYAAEVRVNEREKPGTWWTLYRAEDTTDECAYALVESVEAGKRAVDSHLEAAGWTTATELDESSPQAQGKAIAEQMRAAAAERARTVIPRLKVGAWIQRGSGAYVVDSHGQEAGSVWPEGKSGEWAWYARRALPMSADEAAENPPVRCGTFRAHLVPEQQETVAEVKRAARVEALEETIAAWKRRVDDLKGEIRKARDILSGVDCEGDRLEDQASTAAVAIRSLREVNGAAWLTLKTVQVGGETLKERAFAVVQEVASLREQNERVQASTAPKAIEPSGPLSMVATRDRSGGWSVIDRAGPWKTIEVDECPSPPSFGLWLWSGKAEAERDEQVGGWDFIGEWTALPLPVLP